MPKPRILILGGVAASGARLAGYGGGMPAHVSQSAGTDKIRAVIKNAGYCLTNMEAAGSVMLPTVGGVLGSMAADKLGANKLMASMRLPFRW